MSDSRPETRSFWRDLLGPGLTVLALAITAIIFLATGAAKTDSLANSQTDMRLEMRMALERINGKLEGLPGVLEKIAQIERRQTNQEQTNGSTDSRLNTVERLADSCKTRLDNMVAASGGKMR